MSNCQKKSGLQPLTLALKADLVHIKALQNEAVTPTEKRRAEVLLMLAQGSSTHEVAIATGYSTRWVRKLASQYQTKGIGVLSDGRKQNPGATTLLSNSEQAELRLLLQNPPPAGGKWTGQKVADWIALKKGRKVSRQRGCEYLRRLKFPIDFD